MAAEGSTAEEIEAVIGKAKPTLIIVPPNLIEQWQTDIKGYYTPLDILIYHGDFRATQGRRNRIGSKLTRDSGLFNGDERNASTVVLTSYQTFAGRHGPSGLKSHRVASLHWSKQRADDNWATFDREWEGDLAGCFGDLVLDEAHLAKSAHGEFFLTALWLEAECTGLLSATPLWNDLRDWQGPCQLLEDPIVRRAYVYGDEGLQFTRGEDPFELPLDHAAVRAGVHLTWPAFEAHVINYVAVDDADSSGNDEAKQERKTRQGQRISRVWSEQLVRRTYASELPTVDGPRVIGEDLPDCWRQVVDLLNYEDCQRLYEEVSAKWLQNLMKRVTRHGSDVGRLVMNARNLRNLVVLSFCPLLNYSNLSQRNKDIATLCKRDPCKTLFTIIKNARDRNPSVVPVLPEQGDRMGLLATLFAYSPRLLALGARAADQTIKRGEKIITWVLYPIEQMLVATTLRVMGVETSAYLSSLNATDRAQLQRDFNEPGDPVRALSCSFAMNGAGLNLQRACWNVHILDPATTAASTEQGIGRSYRLNQKHDVSVSQLLFLLQYRRDRRGLWIASSSGPPPPSPPSFPSLLPLSPPTLLMCRILSRSAAMLAKRLQEAGDGVPGAGNVPAAAVASAGGKELAEPHGAPGHDGDCSVCARRAGRRRAER